MRALRKFQTIIFALLSSFFRNCKPNRSSGTLSIDYLDDLVQDGEKYIVGYIIYE